MAAEEGSKTFFLAPGSSRWNPANSFPVALDSFSLLEDPFGGLILLNGDPARGNFILLIHPLFFVTTL